MRIDCRLAPAGVILGVLAGVVLTLLSLILLEYEFGIIKFTKYQMRIILLTGAFSGAIIGIFTPSVAPRMKIDWALVVGAIIGGAVALYLALFIEMCAYLGGVEFTLLEKLFIVLTFTLVGAVVGAAAMRRSRIESEREQCPC